MSVSRVLSIAGCILACALGAPAAGVLSCGAKPEVSAPSPVGKLGLSVGEPNGDSCDDATGVLQRWMGDLNSTIGNRTLRQISIPGSHDAGMAWTAVNECRGLGVEACNTATHGPRVYNQLTCGSRYFDLRPMFSGDSRQVESWKMGHFQGGTPLGTLGCRGESLGPMLDDIAAFFSKNPTEVAILNFDSCHNLTATKVDPACRDRVIDGSVVYCPRIDFQDCTDEQKAAYIGFVTSKLGRWMIKLGPGERLYDLTLNELVKRGNIIVRADAPVSLHRPDLGVFTRADLDNYDSYSNTDRLDDLGCGVAACADYNLLNCPRCRSCSPERCNYVAGDVICSPAECHDAEYVKGMMNDQIDKLNRPRDFYEDTCVEKNFLMSWTLTQRLGDQTTCALSGNSIIQLAHGARDRLAVALRAAVYDANGRVPLERLPNILLVDDFQSFATHAAIDLNKSLAVTGATPNQVSCCKTVYGVQVGTAAAFCGDRCTDLSSDPSNCGACGKTCASDQICQSGACVTCAPPANASCLNICTDLNTNPLHCGKCNHPCVLGCSYGQCKRL